MWRLSGIFRNVTLWSAPQVHIRDFFIKTDLDEKYQDATVEVVAKVRNYGRARREHRPAVTTCRDSTIAAGRPVEIPRRRSAVEAAPLAIAAGRGTDGHAALPRRESGQVDRGNAQSLHHRVLSARLRRQQHPERSEILSARVGFRKIEIKGRVFTINGVPVKLKGANRHENWPDTGHYVPRRAR